MDDRYSDWDAAYVLGSLSTDERREYEEHLDNCDRCRAAVTELAGLPALLSRVEPDEALSLVEAGHTRRLNRRVAASVLAAAAVVLIAILVPVLTQHSTPTPTTTIALTQAVPSPLSASVTLTRTATGTRVDMTCTYANTYRGATQDYQLYVVDQHGNASQVSSWQAGPGDTARTTTDSALKPAEIAAVQIRNTSGTVLLSGHS